MTNRIFPIEIMEHSVELYRYQHLRKSKIIYLILLLSFTSLLLVVPFVKIDLYTSIPGMIRPNKKINLPPGPIDGKINDIFITVNPSVKKGGLVLDDSPKTELRVECYVSPTDIGLIGQGDNVKFQIDGFHHKQWGMASGTVLKIKSDLSLIKNMPWYKVVCSLHETSLFLPNNTPGRLQPGMTLKAMFPISKRTIFQLLFDQMKDLYHPG